MESQLAVWTDGIGQGGRIMSGAVPQERFADAVTWLYPLLGNADRENVTGIWQTLMPPPVFAGVSNTSAKRPATTGRSWYAGFHL